ncbi:hypothetical protein KsCSTR_32720 [Candidatus Kuenenia stuttgartiensis]|jgi:hypothetical protein|uniref:Uncharacterized protein n=1 Tax=Kuenenia stuttgartiensis TaxID=174633 RepID=Q1Q4L0_KUEST|nr:hypothetical protein KsCSTR_32720 [Candidatus Kuenenia stuttgartiensis]TVM02574.1 MAG: hypothetical protein CV080_00185 [Candidatus Kuenenia stuttgartiensis]CAJ74956.1 unknown protein [Candidatus Kuenenia stuttgartiensis]
MTFSYAVTLTGFSSPVRIKTGNYLFIKTHLVNVAFVLAPKLLFGNVIALETTFVGSGFVWNSGKRLQT